MEGVGKKTPKEIDNRGIFNVTHDTFRCPFNALIFKRFV